MIKIGPGVFAGVHGFHDNAGFVQLSALSMAYSALTL